MSKAKANAATIEILTSLQDRVSEVSSRAYQTVSELEAHKDSTAQQVERLEEQIAAQVEEVETADIQLNQALRDNATGTTNALNALKGSTQIAFDSVRGDMSTVNTALTKFNARISALEGESKNDAATLTNVRTALNFLQNRVGSIEEREAQTAKAVVATTSSFETELKAVLSRHGYQVLSVGVTKTTFPSITGVLSGSLGSNSSGTEGIEVKLSGSKSL